MNATRKNNPMMAFSIVRKAEKKAEVQRVRRVRPQAAFMLPAFREFREFVKN